MNSQELKTQLHEAALAIRWQHKCTDLTVIEQALNEGAMLAISNLTRRISRETKAMQLRRERLNSHQ